MSTSIWPFVFLARGFREYEESMTASSQMGGGKRVRQRKHATGSLVVRGEVMLPQSSENWNTIESFVASMNGAYDEFLYKRQKPGAAGEAEIPNVDAGQVNFILTRRYVDVATLVVKKAGAVQTLGTHYFVEDLAGGAYALGDTGSRVGFASTPFGSVVNIDYEFYYPVTFEEDMVMDGLEGIAIDGNSAQTSVVALRTIAMRETGPGFNRQTPPNA